MAVLNRIAPFAVALLLVAAFCVPPASGKTAYEYLLFVVQWPFAVCANRNCTYPPPDDFKIHGIWPANFSGAMLRCNGTRFNVSEMNQQQQLQTDLLTSWPDLINNKSMGFWRHEYNKHGRCSEDTFNQTAYFRTAHQMWSLNHVEVMFKDANFTPGNNSYNLTDLQDAVQNKTTKAPALRCRFTNSSSLIGYLLEEVVICYDHDGKNVTDCDSKLSRSCSNATSIFWIHGNATSNATTISY